MINSDKQTDKPSSYKNHVIVISRDKTQKRRYIELISYTLGTSALLQMSMRTANAIESFFPSQPQWTYYLIATILLIPIPIIELYNNAKIKNNI